MTTTPGTSAVPEQQNAQRPAAAPHSTLRRRLAELRGGPGVPPRPLDARALAALASNPGCRRRALLDGAGVDKNALASALGAPTAFGQSQFAFVRGNAFEARVKADGGAELVRLLCGRSGDAAPESSDEVAVPDLAADGPAGRAARTGLALEEASAAGRWTVLDHPMLTLDVAGSAVYLEPDAVAVHPDGGLTVVEIKSFPILDGSADPAKVGAAARQAAVYALALERAAGVRRGHGAPPAPEDSSGVRPEALLVCPKDFSNLPAAALVDVRRQVASTRRQLTRLARLDEIAGAVPEGTTFALSLPADALRDAVASVPASYAPECLAGCELAFHCRSAAREQGAVTALGRGARAELGSLATVESVLAAAGGPQGNGRGGGAPDEPAAVALRRAARLRAEAADEEAGTCR
ncbi:hypothetical protein [Streptomyces sp. TR02-1]|uniref:hypothetical protein n=1 Tax=Streptomyces sp. TR02-1 TaxID=3385977 RepID=UPI0039A07D97